MTIEGYEGERVLLSYDVSGSARATAARVCQIIFRRQRISEGRERRPYREKGFIHRPGGAWIGQSVLVMPPRHAREAEGRRRRLGVHVGIDWVAMNVNDMICIGAEPLAFVDYVAISAYDQEVARQIGVGLNRGAELATVSIIGGEVAVVPELIREIDLAGTCFGAVRKTKIIDGRAIRPG